MPALKIHSQLNAPTKRATIVPISSYKKGGNLGRQNVGTKKRMFFNLDKTDPQSTNIFTSSINKSKNAPLHFPPPKKLRGSPSHFISKIKIMKIEVVQAAAVLCRHCMTAGFWVGS